MRNSGYEIDLVKLESELKEFNKSDPLPSCQPPPLFPAARNTSAPLIFKKKNELKSFIEPTSYLPTAEGPRDVPRRTNGKIIGSTAGPRRYSQPVSDRLKLKALPGPSLSEDVRLSSSLPKTPLPTLPSPRKQKTGKQRKAHSHSSSSTDSSM